MKPASIATASSSGNGDAIISAATIYTNILLIFSGTMYANAECMCLINDVLSSFLNSLMKDSLMNENIPKSAIRAPRPPTNANVTGLGDGTDRKKPVAIGVVNPAEYNRPPKNIVM